MVCVISHALFVSETHPAPPQICLTNQIWWKGEFLNITFPQVVGELVPGQSRDVISAPSEGKDLLGVESSQKRDLHGTIAWKASVAVLPH